MRQPDLIDSCAIPRHQNPAGQTLFQQTLRVGDRRMRRLDHEHLGVFEQALLERRARGHRVTQRGSRKPPTMPSQLYEGLMWRSVVSIDDRQSAHSLEPDNADFHFAIGPAAAANHRHHSGFREIDVPDSLVRGLERLPSGQYNRLKARPQRIKVIRGQTAQNSVVDVFHRRQERAGCLSQPSAP